MDVTYKIIPKNKNGYKLLTIFSYNENNNITNIFFSINYVWSL